MAENWHWGLICSSILHQTSSAQRNWTRRLLEVPPKPIPITWNNQVIKQCFAKTGRNSGCPFWHHLAGNGRKGAQSTCWGSGRSAMVQDFRELSLLVASNSLWSSGRACCRSIGWDLCLLDSARNPASNSVWHETDLPQVRGYYLGQLLWEFLEEAFRCGLCWNLCLGTGTLFSSEWLYAA